jgi:hypothetical protein
MSQDFPAEKKTDNYPDDGANQNWVHLHHPQLMLLLFEKHLMISFIQTNWDLYFNW